MYIYCFRYLQTPVGVTLRQFGVFRRSYTILKFVTYVYK